MGLESEPLDNPIILVVFWVQVLENCIMVELLPMSLVEEI